jgi:hypothetical protein
LFEFREAKQVVAEMAEILDGVNPEWFLDSDCPYLDMVGTAHFFPISLLEKEAIKQAWYAEIKNRCSDLLDRNIRIIAAAIESMEHKYAKRPVYREIDVERDALDCDMIASEVDWENYITEYANGRCRAATYDFRKRMVKVAALAVAAIEAHDSDISQCELCSRDRSAITPKGEIQ